jgi:hypothetical protein
LEIGIERARKEPHCAGERSQYACDRAPGERAPKLDERALGERSPRLANVRTRGHLTRQARGQLKFASSSLQIEVGD